LIKDTNVTKKKSYANEQLEELEDYSSSNSEEEVQRGYTRPNKNEKKTREVTKIQEQNSDKEESFEEEKLALGE